MQSIPENICSLEHALSPTYLIVFCLLITLPLFIAIFVYNVILHKYRNRRKKLKELQNISRTLAFTRRGKKIIHDLGIQEKYVHFSKNKALGCFTFRGCELVQVKNVETGVTFSARDSFSRNLRRGSFIDNLKQVMNQVHAPISFHV